MECSKYESCSAPLCPIDGGGVWYPDEEICHKFKEVTKTQRKIQARARDREKYFTLEMLTRNCVIGKGIKGIDPEREEREQVNQWLSKHKPKRQLTREEIEKKRELFKKNLRVAV